jgi:hypothetical protein
MALLAPGFEPTVLVPVFIALELVFLAPTKLNDFLLSIP